MKSITTKSEYIKLVKSKYTGVAIFDLKDAELIIKIPGFDFKPYHPKTRIIFKDGIIHSETEPAISYEVDTEYNYWKVTWNVRNGKLYSDKNTPTWIQIEGANIMEEWHNDKGELHNEHGPAYISRWKISKNKYKLESEQFFLNGLKLSEKEIQNIKEKNSFKSKIEKI